MNSADYSCSVLKPPPGRPANPGCENISLRVITFQPFLPTNNPVVVFVPGWISLASTWKSVLLDMSRDFTIHYIETREKKTAIVRGRVKYRVEDSARDLAAIVEQLNLENNNYILCGSSLGATATSTDFALCKNARSFWRYRRQRRILIPRGGSASYAFPADLYLAFKPVIKGICAISPDVEKIRHSIENMRQRRQRRPVLKLKKAALAWQIQNGNACRKFRPPVLLFRPQRPLHDLEIETD
jgi:pimeloyl-ACP methyl ester carboxylesterase